MRGHAGKEKKRKKSVGLELVNEWGGKREAAVWRAKGEKIQYGNHGP